MFKYIFKHDVITMALAPHLKRVKKERLGIYMDLLFGIISSVLAISGIIYVGIVGDIRYWGRYIFGLTFWICWLIFSFFLVGMGIYLWHQEKHFDERESKKDLKAPIV